MRSIFFLRINFVFLTGCLLVAGNVDIFLRLLFFSGGFVTLLAGGVCFCGVLAAGAVLALATGLVLVLVFAGVCEGFASGLGAAFFL